MLNATHATGAVVISPSSPSPARSILLPGQRKSRAQRNWKSAVCGLAVLILFTVRGAVAQTPLDWTTAKSFGTGTHSSIALLPSGLALEFHESENTGRIWYHVGETSQIEGKWSVAWGESHAFPDENDGAWPAVAMTREGYVIMTCSRYDRVYYSVGKLLPDGGAHQIISWLLKDQSIATGHHANLAMNAEGVLLETHEGEIGDRGIYYRIGELTDPAGGDFTLTWSTGRNSIEYDSGVNAHAAIDDDNQVLAVHQVPGEGLLHYRRGTLSQSAISFSRSIRYDDYSSEPAVALANGGTAIEVHSRGRRIYSRSGWLINSDSSHVDWSDEVEISLPEQHGENPSVATDGKVAVATWAGGGNLYWSIAAIN